jgi:hypothetical protein
MDAEQKWRLGQQGYEDARYRFVLTELDLAITFANVALSSQHPETRRRNIGHAQQAYDSAARHMNKQPLSMEKERAVQTRIRKLNKLFKKFPSQERGISSR